MNRAHQLRVTLPKNIQDNRDYPEVNFVVLDYSSTDRLDIWIKEEMGQHLRSGRLSYYRYEGASSFHRSHSRNMAFKVARGDVVCNLDADNYSGPGFADYVNRQFANDKRVFLTTIDLFGKNRNYRVAKDVMGRICARKEDILRVNGYDERMARYGFEDYDLANRLEMAGLRRVLIEGDSFLEYIPHGDKERYTLEDAENRIRSLYIRYKRPWESTILILFSSGRFSKATIIDKTISDAHHERYAYVKRKILFQHHLVDNKWHRGHWHYRRSEQVYFDFEEGGREEMRLEGHTIVDPQGNVFYLIRDGALINWVTTFHMAMSNRVIMERNLNDRRITVNGDAFGEGDLVTLSSL